MATVKIQDENDSIEIDLADLERCLAEQGYGIVVLANY
jgi:bifunctional pyridoxal-dependent enzyme with beta-cystathionase and maltose regulon repressor activities